MRHLLWGHPARVRAQHDTTGDVDDVDTKRPERERREHRGRRQGEVGHAPLEQHKGRGRGDENEHGGPPRLASERVSTKKIYHKQKKCAKNVFYTLLPIDENITVGYILCIQRPHTRESQG